MKIVDYLPPMLTGEELTRALTVLPNYSAVIREKDASERLLALNNIYEIYHPNQMSVEIYTKLYLALHRSLARKDTKEAVIQANNNFRQKIGISSSSVIGGSDCLTIIGNAGIGKSRTISEVLRVITGSNLIQIDKPYRKIIPVIMVQTPFDSSVKSLLLEILKETDKNLNTAYYDYAIRSKATVDNLIMNVSQIALEHIGLIVVDEIQNCIKAKQGRNLVGCLTQLINNAGVAIAMVGTPECVDFFESEMFLARRAVGMRYGSLKYDEHFMDICRLLFSYCYVRQKTELTDDMCYWLWEKSQGNISVLIGMIVSAQEIAILNGTERLDYETLAEAYDTRMETMHIFLQPIKKNISVRRKETVSRPSAQNNSGHDYGHTFSELVKEAVKASSNPLYVLKENNLLEELAV